MPIDNVLKNRIRTSFCYSVFFIKCSFQDVHFTKTRIMGVLYSLILVKTAFFVGKGGFFLSVCTVNEKNCTTLFL